MNELDLEQLVAAAVRAVLGELRASSPLPAAAPRVAVFIGDTDRGLELALAGLRAAVGERYRLDYVLCSPRGRVTPDRAQALVGGPVRVATDADCVCQWLEGAVALAAAALDRPTAVRGGLTLNETFGGRLLFEALRAGLPTVLASDGFVLDAPQATPQFRHALAEPLGRLESFGATCVPAGEVGQSLSQLLAAPTAFTAAQNQALITAGDVEQANGELVVPPGAVITPLALDRARELGVVLRGIPA